MTEGRVDPLKTRHIARLGYYDYTVVERTFEMVTPGASDEALLAGLEGKAKRTAQSDEQDTTVDATESK